MRAALGDLADLSRLGPPTSPSFLELACYVALAVVGVAMFFDIHQRRWRRVAVEFPTALVLALVITQF